MEQSVPWIADLHGLTKIKGLMWIYLNLGAFDDFIRLKLHALQKSQNTDLPDSLSFHVCLQSCT